MSENKIEIPLSSLEKQDEESENDSDFEEEPVTTVNTENQIDPTQLRWLPWMWYYTKFSANKGYEVCDAAGEKLAWFFGITKPKYYSEIQEYERMDEEEREAWRQSFPDIDQTNQVLDSIVTTQPPQTTSIYTISNA